MPIRDTIAQAYARTEEVVEDAAEGLLERTLELMAEPDERNIDIWYDAAEASDLDPETFLELTPGELNDVAAQDRGIDWIVASATMHAAATQQARVEVVYRPLIKAAQRGAEQLSGVGREMSEEQLLVAAREGVKKSQFAKAKEARRIAREQKARTAGAEK